MSALMAMRTRPQAKAAHSAMHSVSTAPRCCRVGRHWQAPQDDSALQARAVREPVKGRADASATQRMVQVEVSRQSTPQLPVQVNAHVDPPAQLALPLAPMRTVQFAPFVQS